MKLIFTLLLLTVTLSANIQPQITHNDHHQPLVVEYEDGSVITYTYDAVSRGGDLPQGPKR